MPDEDQERFEDYVELENYIEALQAGKVAHPRANLTPEQVGIYQMAALFGSATDDNVEPDPAFAERLKNQLFATNAMPQLVQHESISVPVPDETPLYTKPVQISAPAPRKTKRAHFFSRRGLLAGGAAAAASLVVGAGGGIVYEEQIHGNAQVASTPPATGEHLQIASGVPTTWLLVTTLADLGNDAVRFSSDTIVGYVIRTAGTGTDASNSVMALSGSCTHKGCLVQWKNTERHFVCPCHGALFGEQGAQIPTNYKYNLAPLPSLNTKIEDGKVYVEVPL
jgi:Rieske Fe-S protein